MILHIHKNIRFGLLGWIDFFYPLFSRLMPLETFRYAACGGFNTSLDISLFFLSYNYVFHKQDLHFHFFTISAYIAAFMFSFMFTFPIGFYLSRYVVFQETSGSKKKQLRKYFMVVFGCFVLNYVFLHLFVDFWGWYITPSKLLTTVFVVAFSYFSQKHFTFKNKTS